jgi:hypothetical protein
MTVSGRLRMRTTSTQRSTRKSEVTEQDWSDKWVFQVFHFGYQNKRKTGMNDFMPVKLKALYYQVVICYRYYSQQAFQRVSAGSQVSLRRHCCYFQQELF